MSIYKDRDALLKAIYDSDATDPSMDEVRKTLGNMSEELFQREVRWLRENGLIKALDSFSGYMRIIGLTPLGTNFVETETSVGELALQQVKGAIMQQQNNYNSGAAVNNMGDHNVTNMQINEARVTEIAEILRANDEQGRAAEFEEVAKKEGIQSALLKLTQWIANNWLTPQAIQAISPLVSM